MITHHVSVSGDPKELENVANALEVVTVRSIKVYERTEKTQQLDHLIAIARMYDFCDDDVLLFLDYDHLLLSVPGELLELLHGRLSAIKGFQWIPVVFLDGQQHIMNDLVFAEGSQQEIVKAMDAHPELVNNWQREVDFSGYACRYSVVKDILNGSTSEEKKKDIDGMSRHFMTMFAALGDLEIMKAVDAAGALQPSVPFVYHRRKLGDDDWMSEIQNGLNITEMVGEHLNRQKVHLDQQIVSLRNCENC